MRHRCVFRGKRNDGKGRDGELGIVKRVIDGAVPRDQDSDSVSEGVIPALPRFIDQKVSAA